MFVSSFDGERTLWLWRLACECVYLWVVRNCGCLYYLLWIEVVPSHRFKVIKYTTLSLSISLSVWLTDSHVTSCSSCTFCSLAPQLNGVFPYLNCAAPRSWITAASCILHGTLPSIMRGSSGLGTSCQSPCVYVCVCTYKAQSDCVCVPICTQTGSSIRGFATTMEE